VTANLTAWNLVIGSLVFLSLACLRLYCILPPFDPSRRKNRHMHCGHLLTVLGSGGHTNEMLSILRNLDPTQFRHRTYVVSSGDSFSAWKAEQFEKDIIAKHKLKPTPKHSQEESKWPRTGEYKVVTVPRARKIHQPLYTTPFSSLHCLLSCLHLLYFHQHGYDRPTTYPHVIVSNGPATGVIVIFASLILRFLGRARAPFHMRTIYVESWCRVRTLSLSGKILYFVVNRFMVQWPQLKGGRAEWRGFLVE